MAATPCLANNINCFCALCPPQHRARLDTHHHHTRSFILHSNLMAKGIALDSSPVIEEHGTDANACSTTKRGVKRSASTASLLTPPRTVQRPARRGTRHLRSGSTASVGSQRVSPRSTRSSPRTRVSASEPETTPTDGGDDDSAFGSGGRKLEFSHAVTGCAGVC